MENINLIIANNIKALRKENKLTQAELAEKLNYSNKAISRWESGEIIPDVATLNKISEIFDINISCLFEENLSNKKITKSHRLQIGNKLAISLLSVSVIWLVATIIFVYSQVSNINGLWQTFAWAVPASCIVGIIFNSIWGRRIVNFFLITLFIWSLITCVYITVLQYNIWPIFFVGIPAQIGLVLAFNIRRH